MDKYKEFLWEFLLPLLSLIAALAILAGGIGYGIYSSAEYIAKNESLAMAEKLGVVYQGRVDANSYFIDEETGYIYDEATLNQLKVLK